MHRLNTDLALQRAMLYIVVNGVCKVSGTILHIVYVIFLGPHYIKDHNYGRLQRPKLSQILAETELISM